MTGGRVLLVALLAGGTALTGCTTMGGNIKGSFSCAAPDGICAPSSTIDDRALAMISGEDGDRMIAPAGPYPAPRSEGRGFQSAAAAPARTRERVLRIVFPAQIDAAGRLHEQTAVHAVVEQGDWQQALAGSAVATTPEQVAAATGDDTLLPAVERADPPLADIAAIDPDMPTDAAVAAARARASADPVGDIKDQVARRLSAKPRLRASRSILQAPAPTNATASPGIGTTPNALAARTGSTARMASPTAATPHPSASPARPVAAASTSATAVPARATAAGKAAIVSVANNAAIQGSLATAEPEARAAAKLAGPIPVLRASSFPGVDQ